MQYEIIKYSFIIVIDNKLFIKLCNNMAKV